MKRVILLGAAIALIAMAGAAAAADSSNLTVTANVVGTCMFSSSAATLAFGALDQSLATPVNGTGSTQFWCTKGTAASSITPDNGLHFSGSRRMALPADADFIPYSLSLTPSSLMGNGKTTPNTLTIDGTIANADYINATAGNYSDTVVISINP